MGSPSTALTLVMFISSHCSGVKYHIYAVDIGNQRRVDVHGIDMVFDTTTVAAGGVKGLHWFLQGKVGARVVPGMHEVDFHLPNSKWSPPSKLSADMIEEPGHFRFRR